MGGGPSTSSAKYSGNEAAARVPQAAATKTRAGDSAAAAAAPKRTAAAAGPSTAAADAVGAAADLAHDLLEDISDTVMPSDVFVYSDFQIDTTNLSGTKQPATSKRRRAPPAMQQEPLATGLQLASLTIPLVVKSRIAAHQSRNLRPNLQFNFSDFQIVLTENELNEEIIQKAGSSFKNLQVKYLPEARDNRVQKILSFEQYNLLGRSSRIKCLAISPDERRIVACSHDEQVLVMYDLWSGAEVLQFDGHEDTVMSAAFSPDGKYLCSTSRDETAIVWDASTAKQQQSLQHHAMVITCDYSNDGVYIVTGSQDKTCRVWEARGGKEVTVFTEHTGLILCVDFSPDCRTVVSASADKTLMVWEARTGKRKHTLKGHTNVVLGCSYSPDNLRIVSTDEKVIRIWNARDGRLIRTISVETRVPSRTSGQAVSPSSSKRTELKYIFAVFAPGSYIVASINNKVIQLLDPNTGDEVLSFFFKAPVYCCAAGRFSAIIFGDMNGNISFVQLRLACDALSLPPSAYKGDLTEDSAD